MHPTEQDILKYFENTPLFDPWMVCSTVDMQILVLQAYSRYSFSVDVTDIPLVKFNGLINSSIINCAHWILVGKKD